MLLHPHGGQAMANTVCHHAGAPQSVGTDTGAGFSVNVGWEVGDDSCE